MDSFFEFIYIAIFTLLCSIFLLIVFFIPYLGLLVDIFKIYSRPILNLECLPLLVIKPICCRFSNFAVGPTLTANKVAAEYIRSNFYTIGQL